MFSFCLKIIILHQRVQTEFPSCLGRQQAFGDAFRVQKSGQEKILAVKPAAGHVDIHDVVIADVVA